MANAEVQLNRAERNYANKPKPQKSPPPKSTAVEVHQPEQPPQIITDEPATPVVPARVNVDLSRYYRYMAGESEVDIASKDGIEPKLAVLSIQRGEQLEAQRQKGIMTRLRFDAAVTNENLRNTVRTRLQTTFVEALEKLLVGEKCVVEKNKDGEVKIHKYTDPEMLAKGIQEYRKTTTMEEKAVNMQPLVFNLNQQNNSKPPDPEETGRPAPKPNERYNFEDRLMKIRRAQRETGEVVETLEGTLVIPDEPEKPEVTEESPWHF